MKKIFAISIARLVEHASVILRSLQTDLPAFSEFDPDLNEAKVAELQSQHDQLLDEGGDTAARGVLTQKTQTLHELCKESDSKVKSLRYWVKKAFKDDPAGFRRFNLTKYWKIRNNQAELITFMNSLATVIAALRPQLEAANTPATLLDGIKPLANDLENANSDQENEKGSRNSATQERTELLNVVYKHCVDFSDAAEYIYEEDVAKREIYRIPGNSKPSTQDEEDNDQDQDTPDDDGSSGIPPAA